MELNICKNEMNCEVQGATALLNHAKQEAGLTTEEKLAKLEQKNDILKQQVEFLKKLRGWT